MTRVSRRLEPNPAHRDLYDNAYNAYVRLHPAIAPIVRSLSPTEPKIPEGAA
jgi:hypothetical protein